MRSLDETILVIKFNFMLEKLNITKISKVIPATFSIKNKEQHGSQLSIADKNRSKLPRTSNERSNRR